MSTKQISVGDTLTVGDLTDAHLGAFIEIGEPEGIRYRMTLGRINTGSAFKMLVTKRGDERRAFSPITPVKVITPPPVVQPDEPTELGQCIRIEEEDGWWGIVVAPEAVKPFISARGTRWSWAEILDAADGRRIIVSDPPRWPDETPVVPERIEEGEWPDDDTHLREWVWVDADGDPWCWDDELKGWRWLEVAYTKPRRGPWTRGERVE